MSHLSVCLGLCVTHTNGSLPSCTAVFHLCVSLCVCVSHWERQTRWDGEIVRGRGREGGKECARERARGGESAREREGEGEREAERERERRQKLVRNSSQHTTSDTTTKLLFTTILLDFYLNCTDY